MHFEVKFVPLFQANEVPPKDLALYAHLQNTSLF